MLDRYLLEETNAQTDSGTKGTLSLSGRTPRRGHRAVRKGGWEAPLRVSVSADSLFNMITGRSNGGWERRSHCPHRRLVLQLLRKSTLQTVC